MGSEFANKSFATPLELCLASCCAPRLCCCTDDSSPKDPVSAPVRQRMTPQKSVRSMKRDKVMRYLAKRDRFMSCLSDSPQGHELPLSRHVTREAALTKQTRTASPLETLENTLAEALAGMVAGDVLK